jgi:PIN domain
VAERQVKMLVDTCVWLDMAGDHRNRHLIYTLETLNGIGLHLLIPRLVLGEFLRNKDRLVRESAQSLSSALRRARDVAERFGSKRRRPSVLNEIDELERKLINFGDEIADLVVRAEKLLLGSEVIETTDQLKLRAAERALEKKAPFHRSRNSIADALIIEMYAEAVTRGGADDEFAFVTHNTKDFSSHDGDNRLPHSDLQPLFANDRSQYFISIVDALKSYFDQDVVAELTRESQLYEAPPRSLKEIQAAEEELLMKRWYDRHQMRANAIRSGEMKLDKEIWKGAVKAAKEVERRFGKKNLGPYSDFEWGMLAGKHSAIRWVLGYEWDFLDT